jgi:excinuclease ABC subunit C
MSWASKNQNFELAAKIRDQIGALEIVLAHAKISEETTDLIRLGQDKVGGWRELEKKLREILKTKNKIERIEAYDVSNIQGKEAAGSMVTFINGRPAKNFYRRFKIKTPHQGPGGGPNDIAMLKEVLWRRFKHPEWPEPDLILIDGGKAQLNAVVKIKNQHPVLIKSRPGVIALAKKKNELFIEGKKKPVLLKNLPREIFNLILQLRDEAHRFARKYHLKLREIDLNLKP